MLSYGRGSGGAKSMLLLHGALEYTILGRFVAQTSPGSTGAGTTGEGFLLRFLHGAPELTMLEWGPRGGVGLPCRNCHHLDSVVTEL